MINCVVTLRHRVYIKGRINALFFPFLSTFQIMSCFSGISQPDHGSLCTCRWESWIIHQFYRIAVLQSLKVITILGAKIAPSCPGRSLFVMCPEYFYESFNKRKAPCWKGHVSWVFDELRRSLAPRWGHRRQPPAPCPHCLHPGQLCPASVQPGPGLPLVLCTNGTRPRPLCLTPL